MESVQESQDDSGFSLKAAIVCVVGAGLMGGSVALALNGQVSEIGIIDTNPAAHRQALTRGIANWAGADLSLSARANVVVLATPVRALIRQIGEIGSLLKPGTVIIDLGSVKVPVVAAMNVLPEHVGAVGGHPMCGKEVNGLTNADPALYQGVKFALCRTARTTSDAWQVAHKLVRALHAEPVEIEPSQHDQAVAAISHLPYVLASALTLTAGKQAKDNADVWRLAASGFRDMSRLAGSDPTMMTDILLENASAVLTAIKGAEDILRALKILIQDGDDKSLKVMLGAAQTTRGDWEQGMKSG